MISCLFTHSLDALVIFMVSDTYVTVMILVILFSFTSYFKKIRRMFNSTTEDLTSDDD